MKYLKTYESCVLKWIVIDKLEDDDLKVIVVDNLLDNDYRVNDKTYKMVHEFNALLINVEEKKYTKLNDSFRQVKNIVSTMDQTNATYILIDSNEIGEDFDINEYIEGFKLGLL